VTFVALALTLPAELVLLEALSAPDDQSAAREWAASLDAAELAAAGEQVRGYSYLYRREIMRASSPDGRAKNWRNHFARYRADHPELTSEALDVLAAADSVVTPQALSDPTPEVRASMTAVANQMVNVLGREEAEYLLVWMGPRETAFSSALEPLTLKLASAVRRVFVVAARADDCDCATEFGCYFYYEQCSDDEYCEPDTSWPACGWWWNEECDGVCVVGL
jgi:hypothetical protein